MNIPAAFSAMFSLPEAQLGQLLTVAIVVVIVLFFGAAFIMRRLWTNRLNASLRGKLQPTVSGGNPDLARLEALLSPESGGSSSSVVTVEDGRQKVFVDQSAGAIVSQFLGANGGELLQQALQAAAHNTSGKPTVFVNGRQVDADSLDFAALMGRAQSDEAGDSIESRLRMLGKLRDEGLISAAEYEAKKAEILGAL